MINYENSLHSITILFVRISRTPGDSATKNLSTIDYDLIKNSRIEAAFFEILNIKNLMNLFYKIIMLISHNLWTTGKVYQQF